MIIALSGKAAIVPGVTAGIGYAIAKGLARASAEVVLNGRTASSVERAVRSAKHRTEWGRMEVRSPQMLLG